MLFLSAEREEISCFIWERAHSRYPSCALVELWEFKVFSFFFFFFSNHTVLKLRNEEYSTCSVTGHLGGEVSLRYWKIQVQSLVTANDISLRIFSTFYQTQGFCLKGILYILLGKDFSIYSYKSRSALPLCISSILLPFYLFLSRTLSLEIQCWTFVAHFYPFFYTCVTGLSLLHLPWRFDYIFSTFASDRTHSFGLHIQCSRFTTMHRHR